MGLPNLTVSSYLQRSLLIILLLVTVHLINGPSGLAQEESAVEAIEIDLRRTPLLEREICDALAEAGCDQRACTGCSCGRSNACYCWQSRMPNMIGDFFSGYASATQGSLTQDRLLVIVNDLDSPGVLPPGGSLLTITEPGPVGVFSTSLIDVQQLQGLLRSGGTIPPVALVSTIATNGTMTTTMTVAQIQALLASTPQPFDIVPVATPPGAYGTGVGAAFAVRNGAGGTATFDSASSGALLQAGVDALTGGEDFDAFYFYTYQLAVNLPSPSTGGGLVGRSKVANGNSPQPRDRVYVHYGLFDGVPLSPGGVDMDRFTPGFEKTFWGQSISFEMRAPFAATLNSTQSLTGFGSQGAEFGNLALFVKALLHSNSHMSLSGGLGVTLPTASDVRLLMSNGATGLQIHNDAVHLKPFLAGQYAPNDRWFAQGFLELDFAANGNRVQASNGLGLVDIGRQNDSSYLFADLGVGYWLHRSADSCLTGIAPMAELHYNTSLQAADRITAGQLSVGSTNANLESLNLTAGASFEFGEATNLSVGYSTPIGGTADQQFNSGLRVSLNHRTR